MLRLSSVVLTLAAALLAATASASAHEWRHGGWGWRHHHPHDRFSLGLRFGAPIAPYAYPPPAYYYYPRPVYVAPPRVVVAPPAAAPASDAYCREYQSTVTVGGVPQPSHGIACLQPDGSWHIIR